MIGCEMTTEGSLMFKLELVSDSSNEMAIQRPFTAEAKHIKGENITPVHLFTGINLGEDMNYSKVFLISNLIEKAIETALTGIDFTTLFS